MSALPFRRRRGDRALPDPEPRAKPVETAAAEPLEHRPVDRACGTCGLKFIGLLTCPRCGEVTT